MSVPKKRVLLVGAGGFLGPWITRAALAGGWEVLAVTRRDPGGELLPGVTRMIADAADFATLRPWIERADAVVFNAAHIPADYSSAAEAESCVRLNALVPLAYLGELSHRPRPFVLVSTGQGYQITDRLAAETDPIFPSGPASYYLASKLLGDIFVDHWRVARGIPTAVLRAGSLYGPGLRRGMVPRFIQQARAGEAIVLQDGGRHHSDLTFVGDAAAAVAAVLSRAATGIFNVGSGAPTTALQAAEIILAAAGRGRELLTIQPPAAPGSPSPGFAALDISRARAELGYVPTPAEAGLRRTVAAAT